MSTITEVNDAEFDSNREGEEEVETKSFDSVLRWILAIIGLQSGRASVVKSRVVRYMLSAYHFLMGCLLTAGMVAYVPVWSSSATDTFDTLYIAYGVIAYIEVSACTWLFFILSRRKSAFHKYYVRLSHHIQMDESLRKMMTSLKFRIVQNGLAVGTFAMSSLSAGFLSYATVSEASDDPVQREFDECSLVVMLSISHSVAVLHWGMHTAYICTIAFTLWQLSNAFNDKLKREIKLNRENVLRQLERYRRIHYSWCQLVDVANSCLRLPILFTIAGCLATSLIGLYILANSNWVFQDGTHLIGLYNTFIFMGLLCMLQSVILFGAKMAASVSFLSLSKLKDEILSLLSPSKKEYVHPYMHHVSAGPVLSGLPVSISFSVCSVFPISVSVFVLPVPILFGITFSIFSVSYTKVLQ